MPFLRTSILLLIGCVTAAVVALCDAARAQQFIDQYQPVPEAYGQFVTEASPSPLPPISPLPSMSAPLFGLLPSDQGLRPPERLASYPSDFTEPLLGQPENFVLLPEAEQPKKPPQRAGFFQRLSFITTYLPRLNGDGVGFLDTEVYAVFGLPCPTRDSPLLITPGTDVWFVEASTAFDLPNTLHDDYLELRWLSKIMPRFGVDLMITPGWHSDYHNSNRDDAFRIQAHGVGAFDWTPDVKIALGVAYLDRDDIKMIPVGGIVWKADDDNRWEMIAPKPRILRRIYCERCAEQWLYVAGEFGGGQWAIEQTGGVDNVLTARDYRIIVGIEHKSLNLGLGGRAEIGYVFGRKLEYQDGQPDQDLPDTLMARLALSY